VVLFAAEAGEMIFIQRSRKAFGTVEKVFLLKQKATTGPFSSQAPDTTYLFSSITKIKRVLASFIL